MCLCFQFTHLWPPLLNPPVLSPAHGGCEKYRAQCYTLSLSLGRARLSPRRGPSGGEVWGGRRLNMTSSCGERERCSVLWTQTTGVKPIHISTVTTSISSSSSKISLAWGIWVGGRKKKKEKLSALDSISFPPMSSSHLSLSISSCSIRSRFHVEPPTLRLHSCTIWAIGLHNINLITGHWEQKRQTITVRQTSHAVCPTVCVALQEVSMERLPHVYFSLSR